VELAHRRHASDKRLTGRRVRARRHTAGRDLAWYKRRTARTGEWSPNVQLRQFGPFYAGNAAVIALKRGHTTAALDALRSEMPALHDGAAGPIGPAGPQTFFAATQLADALAHQGKMAEAIATLEDVVRERAGVIVTNTPNRWLRASAQLASLYRPNGQENQAQTIGARLLRLLAHADAGHTLAQLK